VRVCLKNPLSDDCLLSLFLFPTAKRS